MLNLVLFGPPGAGKGTQAIYLKKKYRLIHLSTGDLLRTQIAAKTELGIQAKLFIDKGELVPDELVIGMIKVKLNQCANIKGFIFDGFPRTEEQAKALDVLLNENNTPFSGMLALEVEKQELVDRLLERGQTSGRSDDADVSIIENRIKTYHVKTAPVMDFYAKQKKKYSINGMGGIEDIAQRLNEVVANF
ncbi:MAG: adenylate kinase [Prolixibacteraceae bacterium]|jgi:adenylate kinase|nr:adenylate kinase [Prolixibacteraceae bacterium]